MASHERSFSTASRTRAEMKAALGTPSPPILPRIISVRRKNTVFEVRPTLCCITQVRTSAKSENIPLGAAAELGRGVATNLSYGGQNSVPRSVPRPQNPPEMHMHLLLLLAFWIWVKLFILLPFLSKMKEISSQRPELTTLKEKGGEAQVIWIQFLCSIGWT